MRENFIFTLHRSDTSGNPKNCTYPQKVQVQNEEQLREAVRFDHVFVKFRDNRRSNQSFEYADLLVLDCDNDHSDVREDWIWPEDLAEMLPDVAFATYSSRNDNVPKEGRSPRPRFHVIFPIERVTDAGEYASLKRQTVKQIPFFDQNALDAGRFFFGTNANTVEFHPGSINLTRYLALQTEESPDEYGLIKQPEWEDPISLEKPELPEFPVDSLPKPIAAFVLEVAEMLQVYPDMPAFCALGVLSLCLQKKFVVCVNADWQEPINLYLLVVADPSERKSPCLKQMIAPVLDYEEMWNRDHKEEIETSQEIKDTLRLKRADVKKLMSKGKATETDLQDAIKQDLEYIPMDNLQLFTDNVTPEKLSSDIAAHGGAYSIMSAEGGVFQNFAGRYSGSTNCDTLLKAYTADPIRVDRMTRVGETIPDPALTILVMMQPKVLSTLMTNEDFLGCGLNARILYSIPKSLIGKRKVNPPPVSPEVREIYEALIFSLLEMDFGATEEIYLSEEAEKERQAFAAEIEEKLPEEFVGFRDWAGKIVGTTMRIAALLCLAESGPNGRILSDEHWERFPYYEINGKQMHNAIRIARYAIEHARAAYNNMGGDPLTFACRRVRAAIQRHGLKEFSIRDIMRCCSFLKKADDVQKVLDHMSDLGFFTIKNIEEHRKPGRPSNPTYLTNPLLFQQNILGAA